MNKYPGVIFSVLYAAYALICVAAVFITAWIGENIPIWMDGITESLIQYRLKHTAYFLLYGVLAALRVFEGLLAQKACPRLVLWTRIASVILIPCLTILPLALFGKPTMVFLGGLTPPLSVIFVFLLYRIFASVPKKSQ